MVKPVVYIAVGALAFYMVKDYKPVKKVTKYLDDMKTKLKK